MTAAALASVVAFAAATPACPPGTDPSVCVAPVAITKSATSVGFWEAKLTGVSGPGVKDGAETQYIFEYGKTRHYTGMTSYGKVYSGAQTVATNAFPLEPGTRYHFRIVSTNDYGRSAGADGTFRTKDIIQYVHVPATVDRGKLLTLKIRLQIRANVTISVVFRGKTIQRHAIGSKQRAFVYSISAPQSGGSYLIRVKAQAGREFNAPQTIATRIRVL